jgi:tripartite-type tricarboxylate transporter receptor subunit TctC
MVRLCAFALVLMTVDGACAQSWPSRPIRAIVPYTAGGAIDIVSCTACSQPSSTPMFATRSPPTRRW